MENIFKNLFLRTGRGNTIIDNLKHHCDMWIQAYANECPAFCVMVL